MEEEIILEQGTLVTLYEAHNDDNIKGLKLSSIENGKVLSGYAKIGQFVVGASLNKAVLSFAKLGIQEAQKELNRLAATRRSYSIYLSNTMSEHTPRILRARADKLDNPQAFTPIRFPLNQEPELPEVPKTENKYAIVTSCTALHTSPVRRPDELHKIHESLSRLRTHRETNERMRTESSKKDIKIQAMQDEIDQLENRLHVTESSIESHSKISLDLSVANDRIKKLERKLFEKGKELESQIEKSSASEHFMRQTFEKEISRHIRDTERMGFEMESLHVELADMKAISEENQRTNSLLQLEVKSLQHQLHASQESMKRVKEDSLLSLQQEKYRLEVLEVENTQCKEKLKSSELEKEEEVSMIKSLNLQLAHSAQRERLLESTIKELEDHTKLLQKQLLETEEHKTSRTEELRVRLNASQTNAGNLTRAYEKLETSHNELRLQYRQQCNDYKSIHSEYIRKESELARSEEALNKVVSLNRTLEQRVTQLEKRSGELHQRLVNEISRNDTLSRELESERNTTREWTCARLELLHEFVHEASKFQQ